MRSTSRWTLMSCLLEGYGRNLSSTLRGDWCDMRQRSKGMALSLDVLALQTANGVGPQAPV